jgi:hypothetical protein
LFEAYCDEGPDAVPSFNKKRGKMNKVIIVTNSRAYLPQEIVDQYHFPVLPTQVYDGKEKLLPRSCRIIGP